MLRRIGTATLAATLLLALAAPLSAQQMVPLDSETFSRAHEGMREQDSVPRGAVEERGELGGALIPVRHSTTCSFDAVEQFEEMQAGVLRGNMSQRPRHGLFGKDKDYTAYNSFECANCWSWFDVEKRLILNYVHSGPQGKATLLGYGESDSGQAGFEILPFVGRDSPNNYTRWGGLFLFDYTHYNGFKYGILQSKLSGRELTVKSGETFSFFVGPALRTDFEVLGLRLSPNMSGGITFDWTNMTESPPSPVAYHIRRVDRFNFDGFDVGGFYRFALDFAVTDYMNLSVGFQAHFDPSDIMLDNDEWRKLFGVTVGLSHEF